MCVGEKKNYSSFYDSIRLMLLSACSFFVGVQKRKENLLQSNSKSDSDSISNSSHSLSFQMGRLVAGPVNGGGRFPLSHALCSISCAFLSRTGKHLNNNSKENVNNREGKERKKVVVFFASFDDEIWRFDRHRSPFPFWHESHNNNKVRLDKRKEITHLEFFFERTKS